MSTILKIENLSKQYRLGLVGTGSLGHDFNRFWHRIRGKEDPYLKVGNVNDRNQEATGEYVWALRDIDFEVKTGEVLGIIGKNGAGKSTLLKLLSQVTSPTTGIIKSNGRIASLLEVGTGFHPELTGRENIYLNGAILGMTKKEIASKIDDIIDFSGCQMYIDTPTKRYSSGMTVRLAFAVAAHLEPDILIVDEVLAVGDKEFQKKAVGKMKEISHGEGRTVLFVSHNMDSVRNLCTRGMVLDNGMISFMGSHTDAVDFYLQGQMKTVADHLELTDTGNEFAQIHSVSLNKDEGKIGHNDDLNFQVEFTLLKEASLRTDISIAIVNESDMTIATIGTGSYDESPVKNKAGIRQKISIQVSKPQLNSGIYGITLRLVENRSGRATTRIDDIINFEVQGVKKGNVYIKTSGVIQPSATISNSL